MCLRCEEESRRNQNDEQCAFLPFLTTNTLERREASAIEAVEIEETFACYACVLIEQAEEKQNRLTYQESPSRGLK